MLKTNLTLIITAVGVLFIVALLALLIILDKPVDNYLGSLATLAGLLTTTGILGSRLDKVSKNVNGNTTRLLNENAQLREVASVSTGETPVTAYADPMPPLMSENTINQIKADRDQLPKHSA